MESSEEDNICSIKKESEGLSSMIRMESGSDVFI
jgi:hypothetical protein